MVERSYLCQILLHWDQVDQLVLSFLPRAKGALEVDFFSFRIRFPERGQETELDISHLAQNLVLPVIEQPFLRRHFLPFERAEFISLGGFVKCLHYWHSILRYDEHMRVVEFLRVFYVLLCLGEGKVGRQLRMQHGHVLWRHVDHPLD